VQSIKTHLGSQAFRETRIFGQKYTLEGLIALFLRHLVEEGVLPDGSAFPAGTTIVAGRPVVFAGDRPDEALAVRRLIDAGRLDATHYKRVRLHRVEAQKELNAFGATSKMQADWGFFEKLHAIGYKAGEAFLAAHFDEIGREGTLDLKAELA
jgi:hypothetical protein